MRKSIKRNLAYDDQKDLYYVTMHYGMRPDGSRDRCVRTFHCLDDAESTLTEFLRLRALKRTRHGGEVILADWLEVWLRDFICPNREKTTVHGYENIIRLHLVPALGEVKLPELGEGNMYNYWRPRQTELLIDEVKKSDNILINLASQEIQGAYDWKKVGSTVRIITPEFKVWKDGKAQTIVIYMKMARGQMTRYILKNRITDPEALKNFSWEGFTYDESLSNGDNWVFLQS